MVEYIKREAVLKLIDKTMCIGCGWRGEHEECAMCKTAEIYSNIEDAPTADVVEVMHGEWEETKEENTFVCSACGDCWAAGDWIKEDWKYCPVCGAKMDGET